MPATYVAGSVRTALIIGTNALTIQCAAATEGQTQLIVVNQKPGTVALTKPAGFNDPIFNSAHSSGGAAGRVAIFTRVAGAGGIAQASVTVGRSAGTPDNASMVSFVIDGSYKRYASAEKNDWPTAGTNVCPSASLDAGDDLAVFVVGAATFQRTWTWATATEIADTGSGGGPDTSVAYKTVSGSSTGTETATPNSAELATMVTMVFAPLGGGGGATTVALGGGGTIPASEWQYDTGVAATSRPESDITKQWQASSGTNLYAMINEVTPSASNYIFATAAGQTAEVKMQTLSPPVAGTALTVNYIVDGLASGATVTTSLYSGATLIKTDTVRSVNGTYAMTVTSAEWAGVADWSNIRLRFVSG